MYDLTQTKLYLVKRRLNFVVLWSCVVAIKYYKLVNPQVLYICRMHLFDAEAGGRTLHFEKKIVHYDSSNPFISYCLELRRIINVYNWYLINSLSPVAYSYPYRDPRKHWVQIIFLVNGFVSPNMLFKRGKKNVLPASLHHFSHRHSRL